MVLGLNMLRFPDEGAILQSTHQLSRNPSKKLNFQPTDTRRNYLADYKNFSSVFHLKSVVLQVSKAGVLSFALFSLEYNKHLDKVIAAQANDSEVEEFDWESAQKKYFPLFANNLIRFSGCAVLKKVYELGALSFLSPKLADRLTKDVYESALRKLNSSGTAFEACTKLFKTAIFGYGLQYFSSLSFDVILKIRELISSSSKKDNSKFSVWLVKKTVFYCVCLASSSGGYCLGTYFSVNLGTTVSLLFELVASSLVGPLLCLQE